MLYLDVTDLPPVKKVTLLVPSRENPLKIDEIKIYNADTAKIEHMFGRVNLTSWPEDANQETLLKAMKEVKYPFALQEGAKYIVTYFGNLDLEQRVSFFFFFFFFCCWTFLSFQICQGDCLFFLFGFVGMFFSLIWTVFVLFCFFSMTHNLGCVCRSCSRELSKKLCKVPRG